MNIYDFPFLYRLTFLLLLMGIYAYYDLRRNPLNPTKWKEYGFFLVCSIIGSIIGVINDGITSNISADYFVFGKGILPGEKFLFRVTELGAQAGFIAGGIAGAIYLMANNQKPNNPSLTYHQLFCMIWKPVIGAIFFGFMIPIFFHAYDPLDVYSSLSELIAESRIQRFLFVWWIHIGIYLGVIIGTIYGVFNIKRMRSIYNRALANNSFQ